MVIAIGVNIFQTEVTREICSNGVIRASLIKMG